MNILVAYDGTKEAKEAARVATRHARAFNARILLAYSMVGGPEIPRKEFEAAEKDLQQQEIMLKGDGLSCETVLSVRGLEAGEDMQRDAGWAALWFHRAAERGHPEATFAFAILQVAGEGTAREEAEALANELLTGKFAGLTFNVGGKWIA